LKARDQIVIVIMVGIRKIRG